MSAKHAGWKLLHAGPLPVTIHGQAIYYHAGRAEYAIERDHFYLGGLTESEREILDAILALDDGDAEHAEQCARECNGLVAASNASLIQTELW